MDAGMLSVTLPAGAVPQVRLHRELLSQALANLIDNALRHAAAGGEVALSLELASGEVRFAVADRGAPDDPPHQPIGYLVAWFVLDEGEIANVAVSAEYAKSQPLYFRDRDSLTGAFSGRCQFNAAEPTAGEPFGTSQSAEKGQASSRGRAVGGGRPRGDS